MKEKTKKETNKKQTCKIDGCGNEAYVFYFGRGICIEHLRKYRGKPNVLKKLLCIPDEPDILTENKNAEGKRKNQKAKG